MCVSTAAIVVMCYGFSISVVLSLLYVVDFVMLYGMCLVVLFNGCINYYNG